MADYSGTGEKTDFLKRISENVFSIGKNLSRIQEIAATIAAVVTVGTAAPELPRLAEDNRDKEVAVGKRPGVYLDKYCEQVVINIQNTDQRGIDEIRETIRETLTDIFDPYEA